MIVVMGKLGKHDEGDIEHAALCKNLEAYYFEKQRDMVNHITRKSRAIKAVVFLSSVHPAIAQKIVGKTKELKLNIPVLAFNDCAIRQSELEDAGCSRVDVNSKMRHVLMSALS